MLAEEVSRLLDLFEEEWKTRYENYYDFVVHVKSKWLELWEKLSFPAYARKLGVKEYSKFKPHEFMKNFMATEIINALRVFEQHLFGIKPIIHFP